MKKFDTLTQNQLRIGISILLTVALTFLIALPALANGTWTSTGNMTSGRAEHQAVRLNDGRVLVVGSQSYVHGCQ